jgi:cytochrome c
MDRRADEKPPSGWAATAPRQDESGGDAMSMELNKAFAAFLVAGILFMVTGILGDALVHPKRLEQSVLQIAAPTAQAPAAAPAAPTIEPVGPLLAAANPQNGQTIAQRQCAACHSFNDGGRSGVGPNLWNIVGAPHAHAAGFNYSAVIAGMRDKPWEYEELNKFIAAPRAYAPGTRMAFNGIASVNQRADLIAYLRSLAADPKPLP